MDLWQWIAIRLATWVLLSVAVAGLWVVTARRWKRRRRDDRLRNRYDRKQGPKL